MRAISVLGLLAVATLGLAAPAANAGEVYLCELDRRNTPQGCFYVKKSDLERLVRTYSQGTINPVRPTNEGDPISFPGVR